MISTSIAVRSWGMTPSLRWDSDLKVDLYRNKVIGVIHVHVSAK